jgi:hypothetical protein
MIDFKPCLSTTIAVEGGDVVQSQDVDMCSEHQACSNNVSG